MVLLSIEKGCDFKFFVHVVNRPENDILDPEIKSLGFFAVLVLVLFTEYFISGGNHRALKLSWLDVGGQRLNIFVLLDEKGYAVQLLDLEW